MPVDINFRLFISELKKLYDGRQIIDENKLKKMFKSEIYSKGKYFIREGEVQEKLGFITKGIMKYYYIDDNGNEWIKRFVAENDFVVSYESFLYKAPSPYNIEAMEETTVLSIDSKLYNDNINNSKIWSDIARRCVEKIFFEKEKREVWLLKENGSKRYSTFLSEYKHLSGRISIKDTASFLGLTPVSLSRIRNKKQGKN